MVRSYLLSIRNHLLRERMFSLIKVFGLALGIGATLLIALYVQREFSYDSHWQNSSRIYRLLTTVDRTGSDPETTSRSSILLLPAFREYFRDEVVAASQTLSTEDSLRIDGELIDQSITWVDQDFHRIFDLTTVAGSLDTALAAPGGLALSVASAERLFGRTNVVGEVVLLVLGEEELPLQIGAVYEVPEGDTVLELQALRAAVLDVLDPSWLNHALTHDYVLLKDAGSAGRITEQLAAFTDARVDIAELEAGPGTPASARVGFELQSLGDIYLNSPFDLDSTRRGDRVMVAIFSMAAGFVLLTSCLNFTILSLCRSERRVRETAVRKLLGAMRLQLALQYFVELLLVLGLALIVALVFVELLAPVFGAVVGTESSFAYANLDSWALLLALAGTVLLLGGMYPALALSARSPLQLLRRSLAWQEQGAGGLRGLLTTVQFIVSLSLMIATAIVFLQLRTLNTRDPGFNPQNLVLIERLRSRGEVRPFRRTLREELRRLPGVTDVALSGHRPGERVGFADYPVPISTQEGGAETRMPILAIDPRYFSTYQVPIVAGRDFATAQDSETQYFSPAGRSGEANAGSAILNASAARALGFGAPQAAVGQRVSLPGFMNPETHYFDIVGVVADALVHSRRGLARPELYVIDSGISDVLTIRYEGDLDALRARIETLWESVVGDATLRTSVVVLTLAAEFAAEQRIGRMLSGFAGLSLLIACFGLFASTAFSVQSRTREIGIRRVMGARVSEIVWQLLWQFSRPVVYASLVAAPLAWLAMERWLQSFAYRMDVTPLIFVGSGLIALCIAWVTVGGIAAKAASARPVLALRYE